MLLSSVAVGLVVAFVALSLLGSEVVAKQYALDRPGGIEEGAPTCAELRVLWDGFQDEYDAGKPSARAAKTRVASVRRLVADNRLISSSDYYYASVMLTQGTTPEDALLAHDLGIAALAMGDKRAKGAVAYAEDQFLTRISKGQRYGTQVVQKDGKTELAKVSPDVTDAMRRQLGMPLISIARQLAEKGAALDSALIVKDRVLSVPQVQAAKVVD